MENTKISPNFLARKFSVNWLFVEIRPIRQFARKISGNCPFTKNYITRKLGEIYVFYAVAV